MRLTVQRVLKAKVTVNTETVGEIGPGLCVLLGFGKDDSELNLKKAALKLLKMRLWDTIPKSDVENQKIKSWDSNLMSNKYGIIVVSQFTLYGYMNGNKPDFHHSLGHEKAKKYYEDFIQILKDNYPEGLVQTGAFGKMMEMDIVNDGPVTLNLEYEG